MISQASVDYLILVGIGVVLALLAVAGVFFVAQNIGNEMKHFQSLQSQVVGELR